MDRTLIAPDPATHRLRRVGRLARRRMRIDGDRLRNGTHTDGTVTIEISGLGSPVAGIPDSFTWEADRPIALVIVRSGIDGEDVDFQVGPSRRGVSHGAQPGDGTGIRYVAFCYDAAPAPVAQPTVTGARPTTPAVTSVSDAADSVEPPAAKTRVRRRLAAASAFAPTRRERRSILAMLLGAAPVRRATT